jgi:probable addiction module antidote protein
MFVFLEWAIFSLRMNFNMRKKTTRDFKTELLGKLKNPKFAAHYLNTVFENGSREEISLALRDVCEARRMSNLAREKRINRKSLYVALSPKDNPTLATLLSLLSHSGLRLSVHASKTWSERD